MGRKVWTHDEEQTLVNMVTAAKKVGKFVDWKKVEESIGRKANACAQRWHARHDRPLPAPTKIVTNDHAHANGNGHAPKVHAIEMPQLNHCPNCGYNLALLMHALITAQHVKNRAARQ